jgi:hypothetical protein
MEQTMKTYEIELQRTSYIIVTVEAESEDEAETLAYKQAENEYDGYANWSTESIEEI